MIGRSSLPTAVRDLLAFLAIGKCDGEVPDFYIDAIEDIPGTVRVERYREVDIAAPAADIFVWLSQLRVAPYSYDFLDNGSHPSPAFVIRNLEPIGRNDHFLIAFQVYAFEGDSFIACRFCEPVVYPFDRSMRRLFLEYRLIERGAVTELWCKVLGFLWPTSFARAFFGFFLVLNRVMMGRQFEVLKGLAERRATSEMSSGEYHCKSERIQPDLIWWLFCRRDRCSSRDELVGCLNRSRR